MKLAGFGDGVEVLDATDARIVAALHVDGRAPWRRIAQVLQLPERTVTRRGNQLLEKRLVSGHGLTDPHRIQRREPFIVQTHCAPGTAWGVALALSKWQETVVTHLTSGSADCFADMWSPTNQVTNLLGHELGTIPGLTSFSVSPILRYLKTVHEWQPGALQPEEIDELRAIPALDEWPKFSNPVTLDKQGEYILEALADDGRRPFDDVARRSGVSEQTVGRRVDQMRQNGLLVIRALADPAILGFPVGALIRIAATPKRFDSVVRSIRVNPYVRYAAVVMGDYQVVAEIRVRSKSDLYDQIYNSEWFDNASRTDTSLIVSTLKQSGVLSEQLVS